MVGDFFCMFVPYHSFLCWIEDSVSGIKSGLNANMKVIAITNTHSREELRDAHLIIDNFNELDIRALEKLV